MRKFTRKWTTALAPALLMAAAAATAVPADAAPPPSCPSPIVTGDTVLCGSLADGATYLIEVPAQWNKTLFLYSHGFVPPTASRNPATDVGDPVTGAWLLSHGFALAGSSYSFTGWAVAAALPDQFATLQTFANLVGAPDHTIAWGHSLGGLITAGLIQRFPQAFDAALPMCGVLSGGVATWNTALDAAFAFQQLIDPSVSVVNITNPLANFIGAETAIAGAQATAAGRARIALGAALADIPGWFTPLSPKPAANDYAAQEANQFAWDAKVDFAFAFAFRAQFESLAGGNPSSTVGVNFREQLASSPNAKEVRALYKAAGLSLRADLRTLQRATQITADPGAVDYMAQNVAFTGRISVPVLTLHTTGDGLVIPENEQAYAHVVRGAGDSSLLRQLFVDRAGHCTFTPAETIAAVQQLLSRMATGHWNDHALRPDSMNASAAALGAAENIFPSGGQIVPVPPAFIRFRPARYLRPFDLSPRFNP